jgi:hypothetical protein
MTRLASIAIALAVAPVLALTGCTGDAEGPTAAPTRSVAPSPTATIDPNTAEAKIELFDATNEATVAAGKTKGRNFIDALVAAGFDKSAMQLTPDKTAIGLQADNIQFSVELDDACLVGQYGNIGYHSAILPIIEDSGCLIGTTRPINW